MYHLVLILLVIGLSFGAWALVHSSPRVLSMVLPAKLTFSVGLLLLTLGIFGAFASAYVTRSPGGMVGSIIQAYVGLWFMLAISSGMRGSYEDEQMLKRLAVMMGCLLTVIVCTLYIADPRIVAALDMLLIASGLWVTTNYLSFIDRGQR